MAIIRTDMVKRISTALQDPSNAIYATADIDKGVDDGLIEIATFQPYVVLATVTPPAGTPELDISGISDLLYGDSEASFLDVEFKVDRKPRRFRNFSVRASTLTMDITFSPDGSDAARLFCKKPHILGGAGTTSLNPRTEALLIDLVTSRQAISQGKALINESATAITHMGSVMAAIKDSTAQISSATAHLGSAAPQVDFGPALILEAST
ncbi:hypothetical protein LCGC14_2455740, partial [marine sediment metagenome]